MSPVDRILEIASLQLTDPELDRFAKLIYETIGVRITSQKRAMLSNRLRRRLTENGLRDFDSYFRLISSPNRPAAEWDHFLQAVTTHETYLFRDQVQWNWFRDDFLASRIAAGGTDPSARRLRIWSAASSTGDEAYTIASTLAGSLTQPQTWTIEILGTDVGMDTLRQAREAKFGERAMHLVPETLKRRFFRPAADGVTWSPDELLRGWVRFERHNLLEPFRKGPFDVVFLKNVMIYFDAPTKQRVLDNVRQTLAPGSLLVTGVSEAVSTLIDDFERLTPWLFRFHGPR